MKLEVPLESAYLDKNERDLWIVTLGEGRYKTIKAAFYACEGKYAAEYAKMEYPGLYVISYQLATEAYKWRKS